MCCVLCVTVDAARVSARTQASSNSVEKFSVRGDGLVTVTGTLVLSMAATDPAATGACTLGQIVWSTTYLYVCVSSTSSDQWRRIALLNW